MSISKNIITFLALMSTLPSSAATIHGQAFTRDGNNIYTCMGSAVHIEKIGNDSILEKASSLMFDVTLIDFLEKIATTEKDKKEIIKEKKKLEEKGNKEILETFMLRVKNGLIKETRCDTEGRFIIENLPEGKYGVSTIVKPLGLVMSTPIYHTVDIKEGNINQVILYLEQ